MREEHVIPLPSGPYVSLDQLPTGARAVARQFNGGKEFAGRLGAMGLTLGSPLEVLQNLGHGPMLVRVHDSRIALGRSEAMKVLVEETEA